MDAEGASRTETGAESPADGGDADAADEWAPLPMDVVFRLLSAGRRRQVLRYLRDEAETTTLSALAEHIAAIENDKTEAEITSTERKRVYVALYQGHLPKMDDAGVIDFEKSRGTVERGPGADQLTRFLPDDEVEAEEGGGDEPPTDSGSLPVAGAAGLLAGVVVALATFRSVPWLSGVVVGCLLALVVARRGRWRSGSSRESRGR